MKPSFPLQPVRMTETALRARCAKLAHEHAAHVFIEGYEICRVGRFTGVSLGNVHVCVYFGVHKVLEGRFNQIAGSLKLKINRALEDASAA